MPSFNTAQNVIWLGKRDVVICPEGLGSVWPPDQTTAVALGRLLCVQSSWTSGRSTGVSWLYRHPGVTAHTLRSQSLHLVWWSQTPFWLHLLAICAVYACIYSSPGFPRWKYGSTFCSHTEVVIVRSDLSPWLLFSVHRQGAKSAFINRAAFAHPNIAKYYMPAILQKLHSFLTETYCQLTNALALRKG